MKFKYKNNLPGQNSTKIELIKWRFKELDITIQKIADIVYDGQVKYSDEITQEMCIDSVKAVLSKREIQHAMITAINLDVLCENDMLVGPLQSIVEEDRGTFGVDEVLINTSQLYGSIAVSNAFELDKSKPGIIGEIDNMGHITDYCNTFLDDMLCVIAGSAMGRIAHQLDKGHPSDSDKAEDWD